MVILGSDGLWDVIEPKTACDVALQARNQGRSGSDELVRLAIQYMPLKNVRDNVTAIVVYL